MISINSKQRANELEKEYSKKIEDFLFQNDGKKLEQLNIDCFPNFTTTNLIRKIFVRYELYKKILNIHGDIYECGVGYGPGFFSWMHLKNIFEPYNHLRKIIGFDTFEGFEKIVDQDKSSLNNEELTKNGLKANVYNQLVELMNTKSKLYPNPHLKQNFLIKGDVSETLDVYLKNNTQTIVSLLFLDFDLYEPTIHVLRRVIPLMPKGSIVAFDQINHDFWPGESVAVKDFFNNFKDYELKRLDISGTTSYLTI
tara:strand:- start:26242 stop:27003 length:762 start_codon:yes stop_codon:yes gene_type:complete